MRLNVRDFLAEETGYSRTFAIQGEKPEFENVTLARPVNGEITVTKLERDLMVTGNAHTAITLECHRCLESYDKPVAVRLEQVYAEQPSEDEMPISSDEIDLAPLVEQELLLVQPIKLLCREDCEGVAGGQQFIAGSQDEHPRKTNPE